MSGSPPRRAACGCDAAADLADPPGRDALRRALCSGVVEFRAVGTSMRPALRPGDRVRVARRAPRLGDVVLVELAGRLVLHRLVRRRKTAWLLRGDARPRPDGWVHEDAVVGVAVARVRGRAFVPLDCAGARVRGLLLARLLRALRRAAGALRLRRAASASRNLLVRRGRACRRAGRGATPSAARGATGAGWRA